MPRIPQLAISCLLSLLVFGCEANQPSPVVSTAIVTNREPGKIEITDVKFRIDQNNEVHFNIDYSFTSGEPNKHYMVTFLFSPMEFRKEKPMHAWELKKQGVITTRFEIENEQWNDFTIVVSEADSPDQGYEPISNTFASKLR